MTPSRTHGPATRPGGASPGPTNGGGRPVRFDLLAMAVVGCILTYAWRFQDIYPMLARVKFPVLVSLAAIGLYVIEGDRRRALKTVAHPITWAFVVIVVLSILSVPTSLYAGLSLSFVLDDLSKTFLVYVILAASIRSFVDVRRYVGAMVVGAGVYALFVYRNVSIRASTGRLGDIAYYDANDLGMLLVCSLPLTLFFLVRGKKAFTRIAAGLTLVLFLLVIIKSGSRGAFLGLIAVATYLLVQYRSVATRWRFGAVVLGITVLSLSGSEQYWSTIRTLLNPTSDYNWSGQSDSGRMEVWKRGVGYMLQRPLTGVGVRAFPVAEGTISPIADRQQFGIGVMWTAAHNSWVEIGAELGIFGLLAFLFLLQKAYRTARQAARPPPEARKGPASDEEVMGQSLAGAVLGYVVSGFFLSQAYAAYVFFLYAIIVGFDHTTGEVGASREEAPAARRSRRRRRTVASASRPILGVPP